MKKSFFLRFLLGVLLLLFFSLTSCYADENVQDETPAYRCIFTTELNKDYDPLNDVNEIFLNEDRVYIYIEWFNLKPLKIYDYKCIIYDGDHDIIESPSMVFKPQGTGHYTWSWHVLNTNIDKPGKWTFEIYLDHQKMIEKMLTILPVEADNPLTSAYAKYFNKFPGGKELSPQDRQEQISLANVLSEEGYTYYKAKKDGLAIEKYEAALKHYASAEIYYRYGNSLSNIPRLEDSVKAYQLAIELNYDKKYLVYYNIACAYSRMKRSIVAFAYLGLAMNNGYKNFAHIQKDEDLVFLRAQPEWPEWFAKHQKP